MRQRNLLLRSLVTLALLTLGASDGETAAHPSEASAPLVNAHSHNDYAHPRPLLDALDLGFCSIEADVWLVDGELLVGHAKPELKPDRTLDSLYLAPLSKRCAKRGGWVYEPGRSVTLLIDLKTGGDTYDVLKRQLERRRTLFEHRATGDQSPAAARGRPIVVVVSGNCPLQKFAAEQRRLCAMDGRLGDYAAEASAERMPLVSDAWPTQFSWKGVGAFPADQRDKLRRLVAEVHAHGRRLRFWATPDNEAVWSVLLDEGVDLVGADDIQKLAKFLAAHTPDSRPTP